MSFTKDNLIRKALATGIMFVAVLAAMWAVLPANGAVAGFRCDKYFSI